MKSVLLAFFLLTIAIEVSAQVQLAVGSGISSSINMGDVAPSPLFKSSFTVGNKFRAENDFEFSPMDKYTNAGWFISDGVDILIFLSDSGIFFVGEMDYRHRNGGSWAKDGVKIGGGIGYEDKISQFRFSVKERVISINDDVKYSSYFEFLVRRDHRLKNSNWNLRGEVGWGFFKYLQNDTKRIAFYSNTILGIVYKWP